MRNWFWKRWRKKHVNTAETARLAAKRPWQPVPYPTMEALRQIQTIAYNDLYGRYADVARIAFTTTVPTPTGTPYEARHYPETATVFGMEQITPGEMAVKKNKCILDEVIDCLEYIPVTFYGGTYKTTLDLAKELKRRTGERDAGHKTAEHREPTAP